MEKEKAYTQVGSSKLNSFSKHSIKFLSIFEYFFMCYIEGKGILILFPFVIIFSFLKKSLNKFVSYLRLLSSLLSLSSFKYLILKSTKGNC